MDIRDLIEEVIKPQIRQPLWESWHIKDKIGSGSFSVVYRMEAQRPDGVDEAALKIQAITIDNEFAVDDTRKANILESKRQTAVNEASIMKQLRDCPYVVRYEEEYFEKLFIDGVWKGYFFLIRMELLNTVSSLIRNQKIILSESQVRKLADEIGKGLKAAHDIGIIHRDIKPDNMFVSKNGVFKLGDFNISKKTVATRSFAGANYYMAPEIYRAKSNVAESYTKQADIYSFGICLYQLMNNGLLPFEETLSTEEAIDRRMQGYELPVPSNASPAFAQLILKACAYNTSDRYQSIDELLSDLSANAFRRSTPTVYADTKRTESNLAQHNLHETQYAGSSTSNKMRGTPINEKKRNVPLLVFTTVLIMFLFGGIGYLLARGYRPPPEDSNGSDVLDAVQEINTTISEITTTVSEFISTVESTDTTSKHTETTTLASSAITVSETISVVSVPSSQINAPYYATKGVVATKKDDLMLRRLPDTYDKTNVIKKLPKGTVLTLLLPFQSYVDYDRVNWYYVDYNGQSGFVSADYIQQLEGKVEISDSQVTSIAKLMYFNAMRAESWSYSNCFDYSLDDTIDCPSNYSYYESTRFYHIHGLHTKEDWISKIHYYFSSKYDSMRNNSMGIDSLTMSYDSSAPLYLNYNNEWYLNDVIFRKGDLRLDATASELFKIINLNMQKKEGTEIFFSGNLNYYNAPAECNYTNDIYPIDSFSICFEDGRWKVGYYKEIGG